MKARVLTPHQEGCLAMESVSKGRWRTPWYVTGEHIYRDALGRENGGGRAWAVLQCNTKTIDGCPAEAIVAEEAICLLVPDEGSL